MFVGDFGAFDVLQHQWSVGIEQHYTGVVKTKAACSATGVNKGKRQPSCNILVVILEKCAARLHHHHLRQHHQNEFFLIVLCKCLYTSLSFKVYNFDWSNGIVLWCWRRRWKRTCIRKRRYRSLHARGIIFRPQWPPTSAALWLAIVRNSPPHLRTLMNEFGRWYLTKNIQLHLCT